MAKKKDSKYFFDKRTKEWIKIKNMVEEDLVVCGFIYKQNHMISLVLGKWDDGVLHYEGRVTLGVLIYKKDFQKLTKSVLTDLERIML